MDDDDGRDVNTPDQASARASGKAAVRGKGLQRRMLEKSADEVERFEVRRVQEKKEKRREKIRTLDGAASADEDMELETNPDMMEDPSKPGGDMKKNMN